MPANSKKLTFLPTHWRQSKSLARLLSLLAAVSICASANAADEAGVKRWGYAVMVSVQPEPQPAAPPEAQPE